MKGLGAFQIAHALTSFKQRVSEAPSSYNNHIGVPLTALGMPLNSDVAVFELGTSGPGEIHSLSSMVNPHIRVISDIQPAHLAGFSTQETAEVLKEKLQLFKSARSTDALVFNAANRGVWQNIAGPPGIVSAQQPLWAFGTSHTLCNETLQDLSVALPGVIAIVAVDVRCTLHLDADGGAWMPQTRFKLCWHECGQHHLSCTTSPCQASSSSGVEGGRECSASRSVDVCLPALGVQLASNAALAVATACAWMSIQRNASDYDPFDASSQLTRHRIAREVMRHLETHAWWQTWKMPPGRMTMHQLNEEVIVLDDSYNANPASMMSALKTMGDLEVACNSDVNVRRLCVLGCMAELGSKEQHYHQQAFEAVVGSHGTCAVLWGRAWGHVAVDAQPIETQPQAPQQLERIKWCGSIEDAAVTSYVLEWLTSRSSECRRGTLNIVLLKGSRTQRVERVLELLKTRQL